VRAASGALVALLVVGACAAAAVASRPVTLLYTNDLHLRFERLDSLGELIESQRGAADGDVLLLDAGDALHDFRRPVTAVYGAPEMIAWMNDAGYDAMALGNHDLYWGARQVEELASTASFPILCANLVPDPGFLAPFLDCTVIDVGETRTLVIGLITNEFLPYADYPWLFMVDSVAAVRSVVADQEDVPDLTIVLCHLPVASAAQLAETLPEVDVFVSGHSHETTADPLRVGDSIVVQAGAFARYLGRLRLEIGPDGDVRVVDHALLEAKQAPAVARRGLDRLLCVTAVMLATLALILL